MSFLPAAASLLFPSASGPQRTASANQQQQQQQQRHGSQYESNSIAIAIAGSGGGGGTARSPGGSNSSAEQHSHMLIASSPPLLHQPVGVVRALSNSGSRLPSMLGRLIGRDINVHHSNVEHGVNATSPLSIAATNAQSPAMASVVASPLPVTGGANGMMSPDQIPTVPANDQSPSTTTAAAATTTPGGGGGGRGKGRAPHIRIAPHIVDVRNSLYFEAIDRYVPDGKVLKVGRFTDRGSAQQDRIAFRSKVVSRSHAEIWTESGNFYIKDTKSSSGTFLNNIRLSPAGTESRNHLLKDGDILQLGMDYLGGTQEIFKCVRIRIELNRTWQQNSANPFRKNVLNNIKKMAALTTAVINSNNNDGTGDDNDQAAELAKVIAEHGKDGDILNKENHECCICLFQMRPFQALFVSPCSHMFHFKCIKPIVFTSTCFSCPLCRTYADLEADVMIDDDDDDNDGDDDDEQEEVDMEGSVEPIVVNTENAQSEREHAPSIPPRLDALPNIPPLLLPLNDIPEAPLLSSQSDSFASGDDIPNIAGALEEHWRSSSSADVQMITPAVQVNVDATRNAIAGLIPPVVPSLLSVGATSSNNNHNHTNRNEIAASAPIPSLAALSSAITQLSIAPLPLAPAAVASTDSAAEANDTLPPLPLPSMIAPVAVAVASRQRSTSATTPFRAPSTVAPLRSNSRQHPVLVNDGHTPTSPTGSTDSASASASSLGQGTGASSIMRNMFQRRRLSLFGSPTASQSSENIQPTSVPLPSSPPQMLQSSRSTSDNANNSPTSANSSSGSGKFLGRLFTRSGSNPSRQNSNSSYTSTNQQQQQQQQQAPLPPAQQSVNADICDVEPLVLPGALDASVNSATVNNNNTLHVGTGSGGDGDSISSPSSSVSAHELPPMIAPIPAPVRRMSLFRGLSTAPQ